MMKKGPVSTEVTITIAGGNEIAVITRGGIAMERASASDAGLSSAPIEAIRGGTPQENARALRDLLQGETGAYRDAVLFNAAAALMIADEVDNFADGVEEAAEAIDKGLANALLNCWIATNQ